MYITCVINLHHKNNDTNLESVHLTASHIVVHSASKNVHGILNDSSSMKKSSTWHLRGINQDFFINYAVPYG